MIAGETEYIIHQSDQSYDQFLKGTFKSSGKTKSPEQKAERKEKFKQWVNKQSQAIQDSGGIEGILSTLGNVKNYFQDDTPSDYAINMGGSVTAPPAPTQPPQKGGIPKEFIWIGGGLAGLLLIGVAVNAFSKNKQIPVQQPIPTPTA